MTGLRGRPVIALTRPPTLLESFSASLEGGFMTQLVRVCMGFFVCFCFVFVLQFFITETTFTEYCAA